MNDIYQLHDSLKLKEDHYIKASRESPSKKHLLNGYEGTPIYKVNHKIA